MDKQSIDLKYISGRGIKSLVPFHRPCLYTSVYISSPTTAPRPHRQKTTTDPQGADNPEWNHAIRLYLDSNQEINSPDLSLKFDIKTQVPILGDKLVGTVDVPIAALALEGPTGTLQHVRYQVIGPDGKVNGILSFSYILNESPVRIDSDPAPVKDIVALHHGASYRTSFNDAYSQKEKVYPPPSVQKSDSKLNKLYPAVETRDIKFKPQLYPTVDTFEDANAKPFVYPPVLPDPSVQVYPPPSPMPEAKRSLYPVVSTEPAIAYPVLDSGYHQYPPSMVSYPQVEPPIGLASYALPGHYPPPQASGFYHQTGGWDGRY